MCGAGVACVCGYIVYKMHTLARPLALIVYAVVDLDMFNKIVSFSILIPCVFWLSCEDENCRKKNKKINWAEIGRQLGCDPQTAQRVLKVTGLTYLFDDSKNTYLDKV